MNPDDRRHNNQFYRIQVDPVAEPTRSNAVPWLILLTDLKSRNPRLFETVMSNLLFKNHQWGKNLS